MPEVDPPARPRHKEPDMGKTKVECKKLESLTETQKCVFCHTQHVEELKYGPIYVYKNIITHYYCLLLSSNMGQNGRDCDGILGFLPNDINKEIRRGMRLYCSFCREGGATLGCDITKCKVVFHLPCGMKHGTLHQFFGEFKSFCAKHRPVQRISEKILAESSKGAICGICYDKVIPRPIHETLWAPCCQKSAFFHRDCVQKLATSAGYFFKCPLCNNKDTFQQAMKEFGIYIPEQDASWECVPHAYQDLLVRHDTCDSASCSCPHGRKTNIPGTRWELILCKYCGSQGIHIGCGRLKWKSPEFQCDACSSISEADNRNSRNYNGNRHRLSGGQTTNTRPSVSAGRDVEQRGRSRMEERTTLRREKEEEEEDDEEEEVDAEAFSDSSEDSSHYTISNRRKKVVSPAPQPRVRSPVPQPRVRSPPQPRVRSPVPQPRVKSPVPQLRVKSPTPRKKMSLEASGKKTIISSIEIDDSDDEATPGLPILIDDSDDDVELVSETKFNRCVRTNDGRLIEVVHVESTSVHKRPRGEQLSTPLVAPEVVELNIQMEGTHKKPKTEVGGVSVDLPVTPAPSSSATYAAPSTSFAPSDLGRLVLVDPSTLRPDELPPGTLLYRSMQPVAQQTIPNSVPVQYFSCDANSNWGPPVVQMPNIQISVNTGPGAATISAPSTSSRSISRKHQDRSNIIVLDDEDEVILID